MSVSAEGTALFALFEALPADVQGAVVAKCPPAAAACLASASRVGRAARAAAGPPEPLTLDDATENAGVLRWALRAAPEGAAARALREHAAAACAKRGDVATLGAALALGCAPSPEAAVAAAEHGHVACLEALRAHGCAFDEDACAIAAVTGDLAVLQWLRVHGAPWDARVANYAALYGHEALVRWAVEEGAEADEDTCSWAAEGGNVATLRALHELDVEWDDDVCTEAAGAGHIAILEYARTHDAPLDFENAATAAVEKNQEHVIEWLRKQSDYPNCPVLAELLADYQPTAAAESQ